MKLKIFTPRFIFVTTAILIAAVSRLFPHIPNVTPIAAMALFGGVYFERRIFAFIVPLFAMCLSDGVMELINGQGYHNTMIYVYGAFVLTSLIGLGIRNKVSVLSVGAGSVLASLLFFLITNFGVWAESGYQLGAAGLGTTYALGLPFYSNTLLGDLFYNGVLFGAFYFAQRRLPQLVRA
jgi:hypothetical protein